MHKPSIGVFAIAVLVASVNVAAAQRVEPAPMAGGGPGALPSPGEGPAATIPAHPEPLPMAGGGPGMLPAQVQIYDIETGWRLEGSDWKLITATWKPKL